MSKLDGDWRQVIERLRQGEPDEADALCQRLFGGVSAQVYRSVAELLCREKLFVEAQECCRRAVALEPTDPRMHYLRGVVAARLGELDVSQDSLCTALVLRPDYSDAARALAAIHSRQGEWKQAVSYYRQAIESGADDVEVRQECAWAAEKLGDHTTAVQQRRVVQSRCPDLERNNYYLAALTGDRPPPLPPPGMVADSFDEYARTFDEHLLHKLHYRGPDLLLAAVKTHCSDTGLRILDLGCGTGLCGARFRPLAAWLIGVDVSSRMIEQASRRQIYDELHVAEATAFLQGAGGYDVVLAGDVFIYIGDLAPVFSACSQVLNSGGLIAFTAERSEGADYQLSSAHRYMHSLAYLQRLAEASNLIFLQAKADVLRREGTEESRGWTVVLKRPQAASRGPDDSA